MSSRDILPGIAGSVDRGGAFGTSTYVIIVHYGLRAACWIVSESDPHAVEKGSAPPVDGHHARDARRRDEYCGHFQSGCPAVKRDFVSISGWVNV